MDSVGAWVAVAIGVFIVWQAWGKKKVRGDGPPPRMVLIPAAGEPARRSPFLTLLLFAAVIVGLFMAANWLNGHLPPAPGNR